MTLVHLCYIIEILSLTTSYSRQLPWSPYSPSMISLDRRRFPEEEPRLAPAKKKKFDELKSPPIVNMPRGGIFEVFSSIFFKDRTNYLPRRTLPAIIDLVGVSL